MAKDLKDAALEAFKRSAMGGDAPAEGAEEKARPVKSDDRKKGPTPAKSAKKAARAMTATIRRGPPPKPGARKTTSSRTAPQSEPGPIAPAAQTRRPGIVTGKKEKGPHVRAGGVLWLLVAGNLLLLILIVLLLVRTSAIQKKMADQEVRIEAQMKALEAISKSADAARQNAQAKFGVFRDDKKKLHGVFVNYKKPSLYRSIELSDKTN